MKTFNSLKNCILGVLFLFSAQAQTLQWAKQTVGPKKEISHCIDIGPSDYIYEAGTFDGLVDFDPSSGVFNLSFSGNIPNSAEYACFIRKLDANGNLIWAKSITGIAMPNNYSYIYPNDLIVDQLGDLYLVGTYQGTVDFDPSSGTVILTSGPNSPINMFLAKYSNNGTLLWVKDWQDNNSTYSNVTTNELALDGFNNLILAGSFTQTFDFDPGAGVYNMIPVFPGSINFNRNGFVLKLDSNGSFIWAKQIGGSAATVSTDVLGNIYIGGILYLTNDFDPSASSFNLTSSGSSDGYVCKLTSAGNFIWAGKIGGTYIDGINSITISNLGDIYVGGSWSNSADLDLGSSSYIVSSSIVATDQTGRHLFVSKIDVNGGMIWAKEVQVTGRADINGMKADNFGNIYVGGSFSGLGDFNTGSSTLLLQTQSEYSNQGFVLKIKSNGDFGWATQTIASNIGGANQEWLVTSILDIAMATTGIVFTNGVIHNASQLSINPNVDFDPSSNDFFLTVTSNPNNTNHTTDAFVWALSQSMLTGLVSQNGNTLTAIDINASYQWIDCISGDKIVGATQRSFTPKVSGIYAVIVSNREESVTSICYKVNGGLMGEIKKGVKSGKFDQDFVDDGLKVLIYPNPAVDELSVRLEGLSSPNIIISNIAGQQIIKMNALNDSFQKIDISKLNPGVYIISIMDENYSDSIKFIKK